LEGSPRALVGLTRDRLRAAAHKGCDREPAAPVLIALIVIAVLVLALGAFAWLTYNRLVALRLACENSWSQIDVALKLRHDLIPALVAAVAGYAGHEQGTLTQVTELRADAVAADADPPGERGSAEARLGGGLGRMLILAKDYPDLRATENFSRLQADLAEVEEKISITRRVYNDTVETYNTRIQVFPSNLIASGFGFERREFFEAGAGAEIAPTVSLPGPGGAAPA
jgi:LemA protein